MLPSSDFNSEGRHPAPKQENPNALKVTRGVDHFDKIRERTFQRLAYWKYSLKLSCLGGNTRPGSVVRLTLLLHYNFINVYLKITQTRFPLEFNIRLKALFFRELYIQKGLQLLGRCFLLTLAH